MERASSSRIAGASAPVADRLRPSRNESAEVSIRSDAVFWRRGTAAVLVLAAILFFTRLGARALWSSEFRWAEIAREMLLTHHYFWPTINGRVYFDKPLGTYWLIVAASYLTGAANELAARIPCAIAGLAAVGLLILMTRRLYDLRTGVIAGFILATSFSFVFFSRTASADVETITGELAALLLFLRNEETPRGWWVIGLWLIMAVTSLMKGLLGFVLPLAVIGVYSCLAEGWSELGRRLLSGSLLGRVRWLVQRNRWLFNWRTPLAIALAAVIYYAPFAISHLKTDSSKGIYMVYRENVERYFAPFDHRGPIYLYCYVIFALMAPWSVFIPAALAHTHQRRHRGADKARSDRFTLAFFWTTFIFFTLSGSRRSYYLLPILPAAAIMVARVVSEPFGELSKAVRLLLKAGYAVLIGTVVVSALAFFPPSWFMPGRYAMLPPAPARGIFAIYWFVSVAVIVWTLLRFEWRRVTISACVIAYLFMFYLYVFAMPAGDAWRGEKAFAARARATIGAQAPQLAFFMNDGPAYYLGYNRPVPEYDSLRQIDAAVKNGSVKYIITRRRAARRLNFPVVRLDSEAVYPWDSPHHRGNAMVLLRVER
jgi:4-amino-4-deoxy-L-arabinose transferase-like glycosyltransferase